MMVKPSASKSKVTVPRALVELLVSPIKLNPHFSGAKVVLCELSLHILTLYMLYGVEGNTIIVLSNMSYKTF